MDINLFEMGNKAIHRVIEAADDTEQALLEVGSSAVHCVPAWVNKDRACYGSTAGSLAGSQKRQHR